MVDKIENLHKNAGSASTLFKLPQQARERCLSRQTLGFFLGAPHTYSCQIYNPPPGKVGARKSQKRERAGPKQADAVKLGALVRTPKNAPIYGF